MDIIRLLIANRGEVAVRIIRAAEELGIDTVAVYAEDDADTLHVRLAGRSVALRGTGPAAYLDQEAVVEAARNAECDAVHPGYGFLAESGAFAGVCQAAGLTWVGPDPGTLDLLGDKIRARDLAAGLGVPVLAATGRLTDPAQAEAFRASLPAGSSVMVKAVAGGGG
ncbi:MAG TPA: biotin carboxylase N-terminal domain-containing protein, partial [Thermopolyspora sp.]